MLTKEMVRQVALEVGADLCGFSSVDRLKGAPDWFDSRKYFPGAKTVIALAFRIPRGVQRGLVEGTNFFMYPSLAYANINEVYAPKVLYEVGRFIESHGYEAALYANEGGSGVVSDVTGIPGDSMLSPEGMLNGNVTPTADGRSSSYVRQPRPGAAQPNVIFHLRLVACACGLGELGLSKILLTPQFGPFQRLAFIFTDAEFESDPLYQGKALCIKCKACLRACPGHCLDENNIVSVEIEGKKFEYCKLDEWKCFYFYGGGNPDQHPLAPREVYDNLPVNAEGKAPDALEVNKLQQAIAPYYPDHSGYCPVTCGGCMAACANALEKAGTLKGKFVDPLFQRKNWRNYKAENKEAHNSHADK